MSRLPYFVCSLWAARTVSAHNDTGTQLPDTWLVRRELSWHNEERDGVGVGSILYDHVSQFVRCEIFPSHLNVIWSVLVSPYTFQAPS